MPLPFNPQSRWWLALAALAILYALGVNDRWAISSDGGLYVSLGRSLAEGRGMEFNGGQWWAIPPVLPMLVAACRTVTGDDGWWLVNLALSACAVVAVALAAAATFRISDPPQRTGGQVFGLRIEQRAGGANELPPGASGGRSIRNPQSAIRNAFAVLLVAGLSPYLYDTATRIQTDVLFMALVAAGLYGFARTLDGSIAWAVLGAAALIGAILTRMPGVVVLGGAVAGMMLTFRRPGYRARLIAAVLTSVAAAAAFWVWSTYVRTMNSPTSGDYIAAIQGQGEGFLGAAHLAEVLRGLTLLPGAVLSAITGQRLTAGLAVGPLLFVLLGLGIMIRRGEWILVLPVGFYLASMLAWGGGAVAPRYLLPIMPYLVYALLLGVQESAAWVARRTSIGRQFTTEITESTENGNGLLVKKKPFSESSSQSFLRVLCALCGEQPSRTPEKRTAMAAVAVAAAICIGIGAPKLVREVYRMRSGDFYAALDRGQWQGEVQAAAYLNAQPRAADEEILAPQPAVMHALTGLRVDVQPLGGGVYPKNMEDSPPAAFARTAAERSATWVLVKRTPEPWSAQARTALEATGAFLSPPTEFDGLVLYRRAKPVDN